MISRKKSKSSNRWLLEHFQDQYVQKARENKIRSRAWFKLEELDQTNKIFKTGMNVIDLGAAPGSWSQYAIQKIGKTGRIIACDILPIKPIIGVDFFQGDFRDQHVLNLMLNSLNSTKFHLVMSDMAPNITGNFSIDMPRIIDLSKLALKISNYVLSKNGILLLKSFQGEGFNEFYKKIKILFTQVKICKPKTSRSRSREIFILATR
ncbi:23S rRNA (uridine(2552)-2'-O)-methyltransferase RlmE [Buchnera aphidicola]|uniref:Ribosomal RNA large subunit methyltransferase E n=1 Tax=Buchnera aphidicola str. USDA (Myzus persicae) TaxID=1009856 RepID=W0NZS4_BUCMP|nr:23S rRNA (uridine(2552)-2'-O)-methyltransferase RlmE [Buchnera aphidicola]AHG60006.1 Ftsj [Buchnera aphidicola str. USDA (Myzus persicae)]AHG60586.1 Ftsj [Buchnera aphidicola str. W106 (Myzus persicae)]AHG61159.1 Ftsj [Buchnera aphidicola str. G002 (Myzus persicae)]AHG61731.1 Ftsj [Buchnera aphidicola str. F009 (Myzus persicae)]WAI03309.1 MAG: 23S rRNA (uridine(2552)-2'-O)-methyltransferase RlmE [Buchnera aphidicola (Myzus persicae)]